MKLSINKLQYDYCRALEAICNSRDQDEISDLWDVFDSHVLQLQNEIRSSNDKKDIEFFKILLIRVRDMKHVLQSFLPKINEGWVNFDSMSKYKTMKDIK